MDLSLLTRRGDFAWEIAPHGAMRVPVIIYADEVLIRAMDEKVYEQAGNVAQLPGIVRACYAMPDAHWGYGFPVGGVAAFDPARGGVISAGGVGFDISCGVRCVHTGLRKEDVEPEKERLVDALFARIPCGLGRTGHVRLSRGEMDAMLAGGAEWAVSRGYGTMGTASYVLVGTEESEALSFGSACHGAGRAMSRRQAARRWRGRELIDELAARGILVRTPSLREVAEEAPLAYKDVNAVVDAADRVGLARKVAKLEPMVCIKG